MKQTGAGFNLDTVKRNNIALIIKLLHRAKICSRADLARETGLKQATITHITSYLIKKGLVRETGSIEGRMKRRSIGITLNDDYCIIGIRLDRNYFSVGLFNILGEPLSLRAEHFSGAIEPYAVMNRISLVLSEITYARDVSKILGIGMAIPGPFLPNEGKIEFMSGFPGWENIDIASQLYDKFSVPIYLEHNANCGALAELWYGNIDGYSNTVFIAADIGIGSGIIINNKLYKGALGIAGEIGHMSIDYNGLSCECGNRGCLELYCSTRILKQRFHEAALASSDHADCADYSVEQILEAVAAGDPFARRVFYPIAASLGYGLVNVANVINPGLIIISDRMALAGEYLIEVVRGILNERLLDSISQDLEVRLSYISGDPMLFGASALVLERFLERPIHFLDRQFGNAVEESDPPPQ